MQTQPKDDLKEILDLAGQPGAAPVQPLPDSVYTESCPSCGGSGTFRSRSGRAIGPCYKCAGKGKLTFKTSSADRAKGKAARTAAKAKTLADNHAAFAAACKDEWAYICDRRATDGFMHAMYEGVSKWGSLTEKQLGAVRSNMLRDANRAAEAEARKAAAPVVNTSALAAAFAKAKANQKRPSLIVGSLRIKPASDNSPNAGALYVTNDGAYAGKIMDGKFHAVRDCPAELQAQVLEVLQDPKAAAIKHGRLTGNCACCGRTLTDPASIAAGIGPVCAAGWF